MLEKWKGGRDEEIVVLVGAVETSLNKFYQFYVMQQLDQIKHVGHIPLVGDRSHVVGMQDFAGGNVRDHIKRTPESGVALLAALRIIMNLTKGGPSRTATVH